jgi:hypothetical protein
MCNLPIARGLGNQETIVADCQSITQPRSDNKHSNLNSTFSKQLPRQRKQGMKIVYKQYNAVASWRWDVDPSSSGGGGPSTSRDIRGHLATEEEEEEEESDDDDDDEDSEDSEEEEMCGVCQQEFESACPGCKTPGDDCPLSTSWSA